MTSWKGIIRLRFDIYIIYNTSIICIYICVSIYKYSVIKKRHVNCCVYFICSWIFRAYMYTIQMCNLKPYRQKHFIWKTLVVSQISTITATIDAMIAATITATIPQYHYATKTQNLKNQSSIYACTQTIISWMNTQTLLLWYNLVVTSTVNTLEE